MNLKNRSLLVSIALQVAALSTVTENVLASGAKKYRNQPLNTLWKEECGSCHFAYPAAMLTAASWREMMLDLENHFDNDASLDEKSGAEILAYLEKNAAKRNWLSRLRMGENNQRITESRWFLHEHDDFDESVWRREAIGSASNCTACHSKAEQGDFDEDYVRVPK